MGNKGEAMRHIATALLSSFVMTFAQAEIVTLTLPDKPAARAEYLAGKPDKPAVLILHGFLQTHEFPTVQRLGEGLHGEGYTVLAPTLSLGVPHRKQSLPCEAIHTHTYKEDFKELDNWLNWLKKKGHKSYVAIGHSQGSVGSLAYVLGKPPLPASRFIAVSIVDVTASRDPATNKRIEADLRKRTAQGDRNLVTQPLSYCPKFAGTPESLLSYQEWSPERILKGLKQLSIPTTLIMGSSDERLGPNWIDQLQKTGKTIHIVKGANHFLDGEHEFTLLDMVLADLK
jgi:esterase/lipase